VWKEVFGETLYRIADTSGRYTVRVRRQGRRHILHVLDNIDVPAARAFGDRYRAAYVKLSINTRLLPFETAAAAPDNRPLAITSSGQWKTFEIHPAPELIIRLE
jgi:hypothetical protein